MDATQVVVITLQTLGAYLLLTIIGALFAKFPLGRPFIPTEASSNFVRLLGRFLVQVLLPCLLATTLGKNLSLETLRMGWPLLLAGLFHQMLALLVGSTVMVAAHVPRRFRSTFIMACTFGNNGTLPLVLVETLSRIPPFSNRTDSNDVMTTYIFMYVIGYMLTFWTVGIKVLRKDSEAEPQIETTAVGMSFDVPQDFETIDAEPESTIEQLGSGVSNVESKASGSKQRVPKFLSLMANPQIISVIIGLIIGLCKPIQDALFSDTAPLRFASSVCETLGTPAVCISALLMAVSLGSFFDKVRKERKKKAQLASKDIKALTINSASVMMTDVSSKCESNADEMVSFESGDKMSSKILAAIVIVRSFLLPAINIALMVFFGDMVFHESADSSIIKLILMIESAVPSAEIIIVMLQQNGQYETAESLAACYIVQYTLGLLPLGAAIGMAVNMYTF